MIPSFTSDFYIKCAPFFLTALMSLVFMMSSACQCVKTPKQLFTLSGVSLAILFFMSVFGEPGSFFGGTILFDSMTYFAFALLLFVTLCVFFLFYQHYTRDDFFTSDKISLIFMVLLGMMTCMASKDFLTILVSLEITSLGIYVLVGYLIPSRQSLEGAVKYFLLGSVATAFIFFGLGLVYIASGTLNIDVLAQKIQHASSHDLWFKLGFTMMLCGILAKFAVVPFHMWAPDAYQGAPTGITLFMMNTVKLLICVLIFRLSFLNVGIFSNQWQGLMAILAVGSIVVGNVLAYSQSDMKRLFAYSSIAHSGYLVCVFLVLTPENTLATQTIFFYLIGYAVNSLVLFACLMMLESQKNSNIQISDLKGLSKKSPFLAIILCATLLSFAGFPPTVGFINKFFVLSSLMNSSHVYLAIILVLGSFVSLYYYLNVIVQMFLREEEPNQGPLNLNLSSTNKGFLAMGFLLILSLGTVFAQPIMNSLKSVHPEKMAQNNAPHPH